MAGIYIHIPFCRQKCHYCNFFSVASQKNRERVINAIFHEIILRKNYLEGEVIETIYFGGGTPSLLSDDEINHIIDELTKQFSIDPALEITLEANPDDLSNERIAGLRNTRINRLSIGIQSFFDEDLVYLNRVHHAKDALSAVRSSIDAGFSNISIDLIYGIPTMSDENWNRNLETFFSLNIPHLSAYALTVEPKTALDILIRRKKMKPVEEESVIRHFNLLTQSIKDHDFVQYEISNFCRELHFSKHNLGYWSGKKYLGLGPSAHSYNGISRQWNVSSIDQYISAIERRTIPATNEILTEQQCFNEYVMTSLRTMWGLDLELLTSKFGSNYSNHFLARIEKFVRNKKVLKEDGKYCLTDDGKLFADGITSELFI
jgi:oxygen-independent coproporphyrinogen III oxidase